jgi:hypothetical protein
MFKNYFKTTFHNLLKNKTYDSLNVFGLIAIVIALFTISFQATKAALTNPLKLLRTE